MMMFLHSKKFIPLQFSLEQVVTDFEAEHFPLSIHRSENHTPLKTQS